MKRYLLLLLALFILGCKNKHSKNEIDFSTSSDNEEFEYSDGIYCAEIEYYYSKTGTRSNYTLEVEVENNELISIHWPNGGWLDESHFSAPNISDGYADFKSDKGVLYSVEIIGAKGDCYLTK